MLPSIDIKCDEDPHKIPHSPIPFSYPTKSVGEVYREDAREHQAAATNRVGRPLTEMIPGRPQ